MNTKLGKVKLPPCRPKTAKNPNTVTHIYYDHKNLKKIKSLQVLNISGNGIESLSSLAPLRHLRSICASNNRLKDIEEVCELIKSWFYLREAWFLGNPFSKKHRYREDIIAASYCLDFLDDKAVSASTRNFIKCFENEKLKKSSRPSINLEEIVPSLPKNYPLPLKKAVSASLVQNKLHILGPLDTPVEKKSTISPNKPRLKKKSHHNRIIKEEMNHFPGSFSYEMRLPT
ncbi:protein phosphatase 1 regulatory subunit 42-like isoform X2 [Coccinella septempunctata]|uniref:protein phosphatase 1 regulatory subunit 42-like isoform X2 n=1 Tax=Coccinella septempunctata TaxID=41139 RepID=UPI001D09562A|nr:protein phosphatase 1 regulatory subunit 42-like isoform X2 [Coccinella septempunctata]